MREQPASHAGSLLISQHAAPPLHIPPRPPLLDLLRRRVWKHTKTVTCAAADIFLPSRRGSYSSCRHYRGGRDVSQTHCQLHYCRRRLSQQRKTNSAAPWCFCVCSRNRHNVSLQHDGEIVITTMDACTFLCFEGLKSVSFCSFSC